MGDAGRAAGHCPKCNERTVHCLGTAVMQSGWWRRTFFCTRATCATLWFGVARRTHAAAALEPPNPPTRAETRRKEYGRD